MKAYTSRCLGLIECKNPPEQCLPKDYLRSFHFHSQRNLEAATRHNVSQEGELYTRDAIPTLDSDGPSGGRGVLHTAEG